MMLIIDIPEKVVKAIQNGKDYRYDLHTAIAQGIPVERPTVILYGQALYITQGHIDAMIEYERKEKVKEFIDNFMKGLNNERT